MSSRSSIFLNRPFGSLMLSMRLGLGALGVIVAGSALLPGAATAATLPSLKVCADANDLPFSNARQQGFENTLAKMVGADLHRDIEFVWLSEEAPYAQKKLGPQACDLTMATAGPSKLTLPTVPYYRSTYVFVTRRDRHIKITTLDDERLEAYRIGAQIIGDDDEASPPAEQLARLGLAKNIVGYSVFGYPLGRNTSEEMVSAVARGDLDMAVVWGPAAGYFARTSPVPLEITPITALTAALPVTFDISVGVRRGDETLRQRLNELIVRRQKEISALIESYGVPLLKASDTAGQQLASEKLQAP